jgi:hypothetical protein
MASPTFVFMCSSNTYLDCVGGNLFGSNEPWPLDIREGDYCLLHHYEIGALFGLWRATCDGGRNLAPKMWKGKFPFQVRVEQLLPTVTQVPTHVLAAIGADAAKGSFDNLLDDDIAEVLLRGLGVDL